MNIITYFDDNLWAKHGKSWKKPSVKVLDPIVICSKDASTECRSEIESSFSSVKTCDTQFGQLCDFFVSELLEDGKDYFLASPERVPPFEVLMNKDAFCGLQEPSEDLLFEVSKCAFNLLDRVEIIERLRNLQSDKGGILDPSLIWGTADFWVGFTGFQKYLKSSGYISNFDKHYATLLLNLFYCTSDSFSVEFVK